MAEGVQGTVERGFEAVREAFAGQFERGEHVGAAVAAHHRGRLVVDLWGGVADRETGRPWERDTMSVSYSTTKGLTATCLHVLADRGKLRYDDLVSKHWPEFAANGKDKITVYHLLTHQAGIPQVPDDVVVGDLADWGRMVRGMESLTPLWEPGTNSGYHALNFGYLVGEVLRRVDGRSVGRFLREEVCGPLGIDGLYIGVPEAEQHRVAPLVTLFEVPPDVARQALPPESLTARAMGNNLGDMPALLNSPRGLSAEIPAVGGAMTARGLARVYAMSAAYGELDGVRLLSEETVRAMSRRQTLRPDLVITLPVAWSLGFMNGQPGWPQGERASSFGHPGFGGSIGYADPEAATAFGFVCNGVGMDLVGQGRAAVLANALRACVEAAA